MLLQYFEKKVKMPDIMPNGKKKKCEFCEKIFDSDCHLNEHMTSVHEGKKNFVCSDCKKSFSNPYLLKAILKECMKTVKPNVIFVA